MRTMLTREQIEHYRREGYVVVERLLEPDTLAELRRVTDEVVASAHGLADHTRVLDLEPSHTPERPRVRRIKSPHLAHPFYWDLAGHPPVMAALEPLIGRDIRVRAGGKVNLKSPGYGAPVEWHQDWAFYPHTNDDVLAVGILLDDMDAGNGPMMVLPRSHRGPIHDHHADGAFCGGIDLARTPLDLSGAVPLTAPAGSVTIHHARLVHGSAVNRSERPRRLLFFEYAAADAWPLAGTEPLDDLDEFNRRVVHGEPTLEPRLAPAPVRMPLPKAVHQGSLYENQRTLGQPLLRDRGRAGAEVGIRDRNRSTVRRASAQRPRTDLAAPMIREPVTGPRAWTRATIRDEDWRIPMPEACAAEIERLARTLERDPVPSFLLDPADYELAACRTLMAEVRRRLDDGPGVVVVDRVPIEALPERPRIEGAFWLLGKMVGRPVVQTRDGEVMVEVTDTGVPKRIGVRGFRTNVAQPPHVDNSFNHTPPDQVSLLCLRAAREGGASRFVSFYSVHNVLLAEHPEALERLYRPFYQDRQGDFWPDEPQTVFFPVFELSGRGRTTTFAAATPTSPSRPATRRRGWRWTRRRAPRSRR